MQVLRMLGDRILVKLDEAISVTRSGIVLPDKAANLQPRFGTVVDVGLLMKQDGEYSPCLKVQIGEKVILPPKGGMELDVDGDRLFVFDSSDALAVVG